MSEYALFSPSSQLYWDCNIPESFYTVRSRDVLPQRFEKSRFPRLRAEPRLWARLQTALSKLKRYNALKVVLPDLPDMIIQKIETRPIVVEEIELELSLEEKYHALLWFRFGPKIAKAWDHNKVFNRKDLTYFAQINYNRGNNNLLTVKVARESFPDALVYDGIIFLTEDDAALVFLKYSDTKLVNLQKAFATIDK